MDWVVITWDDWKAGVSGSGVTLFQADEYEAGLCLPSDRAVERQLELDVPRSRILVKNKTARDASEVLSAVHRPRFCTQAAVAPLLEALCHLSPVVQCKDPLQVVVSSPTSLSITKHMRLMDSNVVALLQVSVEEDTVFASVSYLQ